MNDTNVSVPQDPEVGGSWILLIPQLPPKPDYLRVKLGRRLRRVGAISLRNGVYVLPDRDDTTEDFMWLRAEIEEDGGDALICSVRTMTGVTDAGITALFNRERDTDYQKVAQEAKEASGADDVPREAARLRRRLEEIGKVDFFSAPEKRSAVDAVNDLTRGDSSRAAHGAANDYSGRTWVTRSGVFIDRIASAWLIRRFIDPDAVFKFVPAGRYAAGENELRFDMYDAEFTHEGDRCTFETLLARFSIDDPALSAIAEIVHDIDLKDGKFDRGEAAGVELVIAGVANANASDSDRLAKGAQIFDALYSQFGGS